MSRIRRAPFFSCVVVECGYPSGMDLLELMAVVAAFAAAGVAVWQAVEARRARRGSEQAQADSELARDEARQLAEQANAEARRLADAVEESNRLREASIPKPVAHLQLVQRSEQGWVMRNVDDATALDVLVEPAGGIVHVDEDEPRDLVPGDSIGIIATATFGSGAPKIRLSYVIDDETGERTSSELFLR